MSFILCYNDPQVPQQLHIKAYEKNVRVLRHKPMLTTSIQRVWFLLRGRERKLF